MWLVIAPTLPAVDSLRDVRFQVPLRIVSADGKLMEEIGEQRRIPVALEDAPEMLVQAFLAAEDSRFYSHPGIDWRGTVRGAWLYARSMGKGQVPGGSTITQQVARRFFLSTEYTVTRKLREMMLALKIERELTKNEILELYLNKEFLGHRAYGVGAAAQVYYGKTLDQLTLAESAMIAALPKTPSRVNPITSPERALARRNYVLRWMRELEFISDYELQQALAEPDRASYHGPSPELNAPWVAEMARQQAVAVLGEEEAYTGGYHVVTTIRSDLQEAATAALRKGLRDYDLRHGWRGAEGRVEPELLADPDHLNRRLREIRPLAGLQPAVVMEAGEAEAQLRLRNGETVTLALSGVSWARPFETRNRTGPAPARVDDVLAEGDIIRVIGGDNGWRLSQVPEAEGALVALEADTGAVLALVGGLDYGRSQFNRAVQSRRQPGSAFKPFIYAAALDHGYTPASIILDAPVVLDDPSLERAWRPTNFENRFFGPTRLREAMVHSRNLVSVRLLMGMGLNYARDYISEFGFDREDLPPGMSMALGSASLTTMEMTAAYGVFANGGYAVTPGFIHSIVDVHGKAVYEPEWQVICRECEPLRDPTRVPDTTTVAEVATAPVLRRLSLDSDETVSSETEQALFVGPPEPRHAPRVLSPQTAYLIHSMLSDVIRAGTGRRALELGRGDLAGKTGTTNDQRDLWFVGFNDRIVSAVWVGLDNHDSLGRQEQGGRTALPIWIDFMREALDGMPEQSLPMPAGLARLRIDPETGLRARPGNRRAVEELFHADNLPALEAVGSDDEDARDFEDPYEIF